MIPSALLYVRLTGEQHRLRQDAVERHIQRMGAGSPHTEPERTPPPGHEGDVPVPVKIGVYVDRVPEVSVVRSSWDVDFYIWFVWRPAELNPGETFKIVSGELTSRALLRKHDVGDLHYALYRAHAHVSKAFDVGRFPRDEHLLTLAIEDQSLQSYELQYVADAASSDISSRVQVPGYKVVGKEIAVVPHAYKTPMGDPRLPPAYHATYSQFVYGLSIARPSWGLFVKMFLPLYIAVALALVGVFLRAPAERLALAGTALFVAIVNAETIGALVPETGVRTLADVLNEVGYVTIGAVIVQAILFHNSFSSPPKREEASLLFDWITVAVLTIAFVSLNIGICQAASPSGDESGTSSPGRPPPLSTTG